MFHAFWRRVLAAPACAHDQKENNRFRDGIQTKEATFLSTVLSELKHHLGIGLDFCYHFPNEEMQKESLYE
jgi:hypothetical protein